MHHFAFYVQYASTVFMTYKTALFDPTSPLLRDFPAVLGKLAHARRGCGYYPATLQ
jgi:hypothetical protein